MRAFQANGRTISGYLAVPAQGSGPGVVVLHEWWGLTEPFRRVCDRLAEAGFVALAPDLYHGQTTASVEEARALGAATSRQRCSSCTISLSKRQYSPGRHRALPGDLQGLRSGMKLLVARCAVRIVLRHSAQ